MSKMRYRGRRVAKLPAEMARPASIWDQMETVVAAPTHKEQSALKLMNGDEA